MSKYLLSRVVLLPDGTTQIVMPDGQTTECTPNALIELLSAPGAFVAEGIYNFKMNTRHVNRKYSELSSVRGLTLVRIYSDAEIVCVFPALFRSLFNVEKNQYDKCLNLKYYAYETEISDEKQFLLKFFYDFTTTPYSKLSVKRNLGVDIETQCEIMRETFNTLFTHAAPKETVYRSEEPEKEAEDPVMFPTVNDDETISVSEYADKIGASIHTVRSWLRNNRLSGVTKVAGQIRINKNAPRPQDLRAGRKMPKRSESGIKKYLGSGNDYQAVQEYIKENGFLSEELRPYIRTYDELKYYVSHTYHEVCWNERKALIVDVNPEYYSERRGATNRDLMRQGKSPVVPEDDEYEYVIHHIGQQRSSPFAVIPGRDHQKMDKVFHQNKKSTGENLHDEDFQKQKSEFWKKYINEYDAVGRYKDITYTSTREKTYRKKKTCRRKPREA